MMKSYRTPALIFAAVCALSLAACQTASDAGSTGHDTVTGVRDGVTVLRPGQSLSIALPSNSSTGYSWSLGAYDEAVLRPGQPFGESRTDPHPAGMVGVGGQTHWIFTAAAPGETVLNFSYGRSWERDTPPAQAARYTVRVQ
jgi:inhibitor of cysteine peptidase